jgi:peptide/nickel transport system permease protein
LILVIIGWTGLARVVRGRFLAQREEDYVMSARLTGSGEMRVIFRHILPAMTSHLIARLTPSVPDTIWGETNLGFLGLGVEGHGRYEHDCGWMVEFHNPDQSCKRNAYGPNR